MMFYNGFVARVGGGTLCDKQNKQTMKILVNKQNPEIRITAPEIEEHEEEQMYLIPVSDYCIPMCIDDWALVEEEPVKEEICSKCVYHKKDDGYCYNPYGGMKRRINENGVYECTAFWEREQEEPKRKQSPALKKIMDNMTEEKLSKTRAEMKLEDAAEPVDLDLVKKIISTYKSIVHREEEAAIEWYMDDDNTGISYKEMTPEEIYKEVYKNINK